MNDTTRETEAKRLATLELLAKFWAEIPAIRRPDLAAMKEDGKANGKRS